MMRNSLLRYNVTEGHKCTCEIDVSPKETYAVNDSLFYVWKPNETYIFYQCTRVIFENEDQPDERCVLRAKQIESHPFQQNGLDMSDVGVRREHCLTPDAIDVPIEDVSGKAIRAGKLLMTLPNGAIEEII